ncbi:MAG: 3-phosphoshikimate 1-carboxyvinyltransferase [Opitutaceae bacterium]|nr:3-phosphoshikimate 1-carboxyvinyltransferase [Opitutaceae bacterium]
MSLSDPYSVQPFTGPVSGSVTVPGSKSITNRALILAALSENEVTLNNALFSEDTEIMVNALRLLGFDVETDQSISQIKVKGRGGEIPVKQAELFVGNSGTSARFLTALCALGKGSVYRIDGVEQMRKRPIKGLIDALESIGAKITSSNGFFPLTIDSRGLSGGNITIDASQSSLMVSALLMVAPYADENISLTLNEPSLRRAYIDLTLRMMEQFGQPTLQQPSSEATYQIPKGTTYHTTTPTYTVEPDASAASYFLALPAIIGGDLTIRQLSLASLQGDIGFTQMISLTGCQITESPEGVTSSFPVNDLPAQGLDQNFFRITDTFLTLAAISPLLKGETQIQGIAHTRHQECDRVSAMTHELTRIGQNVLEEENAITVTPAPLQSAEIETYHDHRVAMSFGILGSYDLMKNGGSWLKIKDPLCCAKTFPTFFETLENLRQQSLNQQSP